MAKSIVQSLTNEGGEPRYAHKWNNDVIDLPIVRKREQKRPTLASEAVTAIIGASTTDWERMLYVLCPATEMRVAEALALNIDQHILADCTIIRVEQQVKGNRAVRYLKTTAAYREIDLCPEVSTLLREYIAERHGWLFPSSNGRTPKMYTTVRRLSFHPKLAKFGLYTERTGLHCYRRFRAARLREQGCPEDLRKYWLGHENQDMSDHYAEQLLADRNRRQEWGTEGWARIRDSWWANLQYSLQ